MKKLVQSEDRKAFMEFYVRLGQKENIFFLYCTSNLLHYVIHSVALHKQFINMVLITGGLSEEEKEFVSTQIGIPACNLSKAYIDFYIWDLLIETCEENFGWLDIDCFVHDKRIIEELCRMEPTVSINAVWERKYAFYQYEGKLSSTYLDFVNIKIAREIWKSRPWCSMIPIAFPRHAEDIAFEEFRMLEDHDLEDLRKVYPKFEENTVGLDTTHYYQILAASLGYDIRLIRNLKGNEYSKEIIHLGGCHIMDRMKLGVNRHRSFDRFKMRYSYWILDQYKEILPEQYGSLLKRYGENMISNGLKTDMNDVREKIKDYVQMNDIPLPTEN